jgi:hypothetical protein
MNSNKERMNTYKFAIVRFSFILLIVLTVKFMHAQELTEKDIMLLYVGAVETHRSSWPRDNTLEGLNDTTMKKFLKVMFYREGQDWVSLSDKIADTNFYPAGGKWYLAFDGTMPGSFHSKIAKLIFPDDSWTYTRDTYHDIEEKDLPTIGIPSEDFSSWAYEKGIRPIIAVSRPNYSDPDQWKPYKPDILVLDKLFPVYKSYILKLYPGFKGVDKSELRLLKSYRSNSNKSIMQVGMVSKYDPKRISYSVWIYESSTGDLKNLSEMIDYSYSQDDFTDDDYSNCTLVDAGDYDADGKSEIIFCTTRYNGDGYVIFWNDCSKMAEFSWSYH